MTVAIAFNIDIEVRYETDSYSKRQHRLRDGIAVDHEILGEIVAESFVGQLMEAEGVRWEFSPVWGEIRLLDPTDVQLVAIRLALSENEHMFVYQDEEKGVACATPSLLNTAV